MRLHLIRHTSVAVKAGVCYGQSDVALACSFEDEKKRVLTLVENLQFDKIYSSPLMRCKLLAESLFDKREIIFDDRLKELNFGDWELKSWDAIYSDPMGKVWMDNYQKQPTLNGESYPEMGDRVKSFLSEIISDKKINVAIVAHAGVIRIIKSIAENTPIDELFRTFKPDYGSVTEFNIL